MACTVISILLQVDRKIGKKGANMDAYTEQVLVMALGAIGLAKSRRILSPTQESEATEAMKHLGNILLEDEHLRRGRAA
ncbi:MAG TPA: hypothetical protein DCE18_09740 [Syntrophobacteraceae bacterium]|nr:hypothetical protein [Syntrophobacteraceae bacterium]